MNNKDLNRKVNDNGIDGEFKYNLEDSQSLIGSERGNCKRKEIESLVEKEETIISARGRVVQKSLKLIHYKPLESNTLASEGQVRLIKNEFIQNKQLIPYYHDWKVILRNHYSNQMVLYNQESHELAITKTNQIDEFSNPHDEKKCKLCHQYLPNYYPQEEEKEPKQESSNSYNMSYSGSDKDSKDIDFMDKNYFKCLAISHEQKRLSHLLMEDHNDHPVKSEPILNDSAFNQGYYHRFFREIKKLGHGASGNVYLCQHFLDNIKLGSYAIKKVSIGHNHSWLARMLREVHMLERLHHQNIIDYKHAWIENHKLSAFSPEVPCLFILMECANGGNLEEYVERRKAKSLNKDDNIDLNLLSAKERVLYMRRQKDLLKSKDKSEIKDQNLLTLKEIWSLFLDICNGLAHLHRYNIIHRDIKPPNLLLSLKEGTKNSNEIPKVLISDFGECVNLDNLNGVNRTGATGTLEFMAPELIKIDNTGTYIGDHSSKADMWSLGMVLYYLCYSQLPYRQIDDIDILKDEILAFKEIESFPDDINKCPRIPTSFKQLIVLLLSSQPNKRPDAQDILKQANEVNFEKLIPGMYVKASETTVNISTSIGIEETIIKSDDKYKPKTSSPLNPSSSKRIAETIPLLDRNLMEGKASKELKTSKKLDPVLLLILGLKFATLLFPCYPKSIHIFALVPLTSLAIWALTMESRQLQLFFLGIHATFLVIIYLSLDGLCT
ncbi:kinase-like protein [Neoconidiobolus thromboides FSU 785]|nr:kinase-like protein [Neoconidiobolus thromboides FSU 785]